MASTYSTNLKIELQATGENSGTWGTITNTNLGTALEQAIVGYGNPSYASDANLTLTYTDTNAAQAARALVLNVTSAVSLSATRELVVPTIQKQYIVQNNTTGSQSITVKTSGGTGITVPNGRKAHLYVDGTNVIFMDDFVDINGGAIDGTTIGANSAAAGTFTTVGATTGNITTVNATTVDTTNIEVTNLKAKDGTAAGSIADSTGVVTLGSSVLTTTDINGGTIDGTTIGGSSAAAGTFTTLTSSSTVTVNGGTANQVQYLNASKQQVGSANLTFDGTTLTAANFADSSLTSGRVTYAGASGNLTDSASLTFDGTTLATTTVDATNVEVTNIKAKDGTAAASIADSTGVISLTSNPTLSDGTANGVLYLNASKVATSGSALTFNGTTFTAVANAVVGDGTAATRRTLIVNGGANTGVGAYLGVQVGGSLVGTLASSGWAASDTSTDLAVYADTGKSIRFYSAATEQMRLNSSGNLGIGTTTVSYDTGKVGSTHKFLNLQAGASLYAVNTLAGNQSAAGNRLGMLAFVNDTNSASYKYSAWVLSETEGTTANQLGARLVFSTLSDASAAGPVERMRITSTGNVGIGTSSPSSALEVSSGSDTVLTINAANNADAKLVFSEAGSAEYSIIMDGLSGSTQSLQFYNNRTATEAMRISSAGNVGIGTSSPTVRLDISGATNTTSRARFTRSDQSTTLQLGAFRDTSNVPYIGSETNHALAFITNDTERMRLDASGNLGLGTSSPTAKLDVAEVNFANISRFSRNITGTNSVGSAARIRTSTTGDMVDGFGTGLVFSIEDNAAVQNDIAFINAIRAGADNTGSLTFSTVSAGTAAVRAVIDSSSNLGLGVTPSAVTLGPAFQIANGAVLQSLSGGFTELSNNAIYNAGFKYISSSTATLYEQGAGAHKFFTAPSGTAGNAITFTQAMTLTAAGELLVGGTTAISSASGAVTIQYPDAAPILNLYRNDTTITAGNSLGNIYFHGNDTTSNTPTILAAIQGVASDTHAAGDNPTDVVFSTTPDGSATFAEAGRITQSGSYVLKGGTTTAAAGVGIIFPATQVASADANSLDDYEEGTWTPTLVGNTTAGTYTFSSTRAIYTKIGRAVFVSASLTLATASGGVGVVKFGGLPFTKTANQAFTGSVVTENVDLTANTVSLAVGQWTIINTSTEFTIFQMQDNAESVLVDIAGISSGDVISFSFLYFV